MESTRQELEWLSNRKENKRRKNYRRDERKDQIEHVVYEYLYMHRKAMTMRQIADAVGMSPQMHLIRILDEMVDAERLLLKPFDYNGGKCSYRCEYTIPPQKVAAGVAGALDMKAGAE